MPLSRLWAGRVYGTHTGNVFVKLQGQDEALSGTLRFAQDGAGLVVYNVHGSFDGTRLMLLGTVAMQPPGSVAGDLSAEAYLKATGNLAGEWQTTVGSAGTLVLYPHDNPETANAGLTPDQLHTARQLFRAIDITREQIVELADEVQKDFMNARVVVTIAAETEESRFLDDYRNRTPRTDRARFLKLYVSEPEKTGTVRLISIEFGHQYNALVTQGGNEEWVLGSLERLKRVIRRYERVYTANAEWYGIGLKPILLLGAIAWVPSLDNFRDRVALLGSVFLLNVALDWFHQRYLPHAAIYLMPQRQGLAAKFGLQMLSWLAGIASAIAAAIVGAYLKGWLQLAP
jgi:hypothetical protein